MKIELREVSIRDVVDGYFNKNDDGVVGLDGKLNIRPAYQREFVYKEKQRNAVIDTVLKGYPLNVMYWAKSDADGFEIIDGQQRTISFCEFVDGNFSVVGVDGHVKYFTSLTQDEQAKFLDYKLFIYICEGSEGEKLEWFRTINIAGMKLTEQELRNAVYAGPWLTDAKRHFSKPGCPAYSTAHKYLDGSAVRQDYLETALAWASDGQIEKYMAERQHKPNAKDLWLHFQKVIAFVDAHFGNHYRREMKGVDFGSIYRSFHAKDYDSGVLEAEVSKLMRDEDVTSKSGIYPYVFDRNEKHLNIRAFTDNQRREAFERQKGVCPKCEPEAVWTIEEMEADHITPWHGGGRTSSENCQMLCKHHNRVKSGK